MKIAIVYVHAGLCNQKYQNYSARFLESYHQNPPRIDHETIVVVNGGKPNSEMTCMFSLLPKCRFLEHDNSGYDIGAFQLAARTVPCDMMVFFGSSTWFNREGWLVRMALAFRKHGNAQYGAMGNRGDEAVKVWPHIRTTAFWMDPGLMNSYPKRIERPEERHPFEHGKDCFTSWVKHLGLKSWVITWNKELLWADWDSDPNGFQTGNQSSLLALDHICERPYFPNNMCVRPKPNMGPYCDPWRSENCWPCLTHA